MTVDAIPEKAVKHDVKEWFKTAPCCMNCSGRLLKYYRKRMNFLGEEAKTGDDDPQGTGKKILEVVRKDINYLGSPSCIVYYWCGEWGESGEGFFCSTRCGYVWAVGKLLEKEKENDRRE